MAQSDLLRDVNDEQRQAITTTEGPLLIVAGAGTGKTRVITRRLAYLIQAKGLNPSNVLALTYTDKAAAEMRERVEDLLGSAGGDFWVSTFHAFCLRILRERAMDMGLPNDFLLFSEADQWAFVHNLIPQLQMNYYGRLSDPSSSISPLLKFISRCKDELVSPEEYQAYAAQLRDELEAERPNLDPLEAEARELEARREEELGRVYGIIQQQMWRAGRLDYGDLITATIELFRQRPNILRAYQKQFRYVLVDEFQDANMAQIELLELLATEHRNICVVGDDDQSIYRFRGASYASFVTFEEKFPDLQTVKLTQNYRSTGRVLQVAERLIAQNADDRYDPEKNLWTTNPLGDEVMAYIAPDYPDEAKAIADEIEQVRRSISQEEWSYSNVAVLYRSHSHRDLIVEQLKREKIPFVVRGGEELSRQEEIKDLLSYLFLVRDPLDDAHLLRLLTLPRWEIDTTDLMALTRRAASEKKSLFEVLEDASQVEDLAQDAQGKISFLIATLKDLAREARRMSAADFLIHLLEKTGYAGELLVHSSAEIHRKMANIGRLYDFFKAYEETHREETALAFINGYLDPYLRAGGSMGEAQEEQSAEGVQLMTVHAAKGLEFPIVFVVSMVQNRFPTRRRTEEIPFPDVLIKERLPSGDFHTQEERRLCYVAFTRAKERLYLTSVDKPHQRPSIFLREIMEGEPDDLIVEEVTAFEPEEAPSIPLKIDRERVLLGKQATRAIGEMVSGLPAVEMEHRLRLALGALVDLASRDDFSMGQRVGEWLQSRKAETSPLKSKGISIAPPLPSPLKLSFSSLERFRRCPLEYKLAEIYRLPGRPRADATFGSVIHNVLEDIYVRVGQGRVPSWEDVVQMLNQRWQRRGFDGPNQENDYKERGLQELEAFYRSHEGAWQPARYLEKRFEIPLGDDLIVGKIDRIDELSGGSVEVIDYKTTERPKDPKNQKDQKMVDKDLQLSIYALACRERFGLEPQKLSFYYLKNNEKLSTSRSDGQLDETKEMILETAAQIRSSDFAPQPDRFSCGRCDYQWVCPDRVHFKASDDSCFL